MVDEVPVGAPKTIESDRARVRTGSAGTSPRGAATPHEALSAVVHRLRSELEGLRRAMRNRAVIEQAKGVLAARFTVTPEDAFDQLLDLSQRTNTKLVEVAAALVGTTAPDPGSPSVGALYNEEIREYIDSRRRRTAAEVDARPPSREEARQLRGIHSPEREALQSQQQLLAARIASTGSYEEIVQTIVDTVTAWPRPATVVLGLAELDGALRVSASHGLSAEVRSQWTRIPPQVHVPLASAARERKAFLLSEADLTEHFPVVREIAPDTQSMACLPLVVGDHVLGVLAIAWREQVRLTGLNRRYLLALADSCARSLRPGIGAKRAQAAEPTLTVEHRVEYGLLPIVLDQLYDAAALLAPITEGGRTVDFEFEYANPAAHELSAVEHIQLSNSTLLEVFPEVGSRLLLGEYAKVLRTGQPYRLDDLYIAADREGLRGSYTFATHATRIADRVLVVWRARTDADLLHDQLLEAERIARSGSFWWNLRSGDLRWSPGMYRLFSRDPDNGPVGLDQFSDHVHPDDWLGVQNALTRLLAGRTTELEFRLTGHAAGRRLRLRAEPATENSEVHAISGSARDVSEERAAETRLRRAEEALAAQRMRLDSERHAAASLRDAVLPTAPQLAVIPGLTVRGVCRSPEGADGVAGDWYDVLSLDGRIVLVVGDVAGSGLPATTAATQLRSALRSYAVLGMSPAELLGALNRMLCVLDPDRLATLGVTEYRPQSRVVRWATAGQAAPVRYTEAQEASLLHGEAGVPIGTFSDAEYSDAELAVDPGERLLLYTDGLVGRRDAGLTDGLEVLLRAGHEVDLDDVDALVDHVTEKLGSLPHDDLCVITAHVL